MMTLMMGPDDDNIDNNYDNIGDDIDKGNHLGQCIQGWVRTKFHFCISALSFQPDGSLCCNAPGVMISSCHNPYYDDLM